MSTLNKMMPADRVPREYLEAIYAAWDYYGEADKPRLLGTSEAQRIYHAIRAVLIERCEQE